MTKPQHPITPPPELVQQWKAAASNVPATLSTDPGGRRDYIDFIATRAAQWGADQELEACCEWAQGYAECGDSLRIARRPKPPSLVEKALEAWEGLMASYEETDADMNTIRLALERLQELEGGDE